jgi:hypothetical protein
VTSWIGDVLFCQFDTLDVTVQEEFDKWLGERGINESLALFVMDYAEYKEQKVSGLCFVFLWWMFRGFLYYRSM